MVNALTIGKLVPLALFIVTGIWFIHPSHWSTMPVVTPQQAGAAALLLIFAYGGYEVTGVLAGEAANPKRDVPFAFVHDAARRGRRDDADVGHRDRRAARHRRRPGRRWPTAPCWSSARPARLMVSLGSSVSMAGNNMGQILNGSRTLFALAENGDLPRWFARVHPDYRTPENAILFTAVVALSLALAGSFVLPGRGQRRRPAGDVPRRLPVDAGASPAEAGPRRWDRHCS